jgi:hypothetical protein
MILNTSTDFLHHAMKKSNWNTFESYIPLVLNDIKNNKPDAMPKIKHLFDYHTINEIKQDYIFPSFIKSFYPLMSNQEKYEQLIEFMDASYKQLKNEQYAFRDHRAFFSFSPRQSIELISQINFENKKLRTQFYEKISDTKLFYLALLLSQNTQFNQDIEYFNVGLEFIIECHEKHVIKPFLSHLKELSEVNLKLVFLMEHWKKPEGFFKPSLVFNAFFQCDSDIFEAILNLGGRLRDDEIEQVASYKDYTETFNQNYMLYEKSRLNQLVIEKETSAKKQIKI